MTRHFVSVADLFAGWRSEILGSDPPATWSIGDPAFDHVEVAPGRVILLGGAPGAGKTALLLQWVGGILDTEPDARVLIANVEMSPKQLLTRSLSRLSGVALTDIRGRRIRPQDQARLDEGLARIESYGDRLAFAATPGNLDAVRNAAAAHRADILCVDYIQRVEPSGKSGATRDRINALMSELRRLADGGTAILAAAALARSRDSKGRASYAGANLGMASFRESSELEYGCDSAFLLVSADEEEGGPIRSMTLKHEKNREGETRDVFLEFDRRVQRFGADPFLNAASASAPPADRVREAWGAAARNGQHGISN